MRHRIYNICNRSNGQMKCTLQHPKWHCYLYLNHKKPSLGWASVNLKLGVYQVRVGFISHKFRKLISLPKLGPLTWGSWDHPAWMFSCQSRRIQGLYRYSVTAQNISNAKKWHKMTIYRQLNNALELISESTEEF